MKRISLFFVCAFLIGCNSQPAPFDGEIAFQYLEEQCQLGPRNPGSEGHARAKDFYLDFFHNLADTVIRQDIDRYIERDSLTLPLTNIVAGFALEQGNPLLLGAHWDTRPWADHDPDPQKRNQPILGANDGASGVAVLMHLAEHLQQQTPNRTVYIVLFDGEDYGSAENLNYYCLGSEHFAKNLPIEKPSEAIIIDMIGDADLRIPVERNSFRSHPNLVNIIWDIAKARNYEEFVHQLGNEIYDDHLMLISYANIPSIDIIDFNYPNRFTNYWHTTEDTPDKCSPHSLAIVGQVLHDYVYENYSLPSN